MLKLLVKHKTLLLILAALVVGIFARFYNLGTLTSPYWEEVALGYDAYSIAQTGRDHHGHWYPLVAFESFGDWKPSGYFYAVAPFVKFLGLSALAVRLPAAIAGVVIIVMTMLLAKRFNVSAPAAGFIAALSPWGILFSRAAWEVNLGTAFFLSGITAALYTKDNRNNILLWVISIILIVFSAYTYHALRVIAPLVLGMVILYKALENYHGHKMRFVPWLAQKGYTFIFPVIAVSILLFPLLLGVNKPEISLRFTQTSIFSDISVIRESNELRELHNNSLTSRIVYHRYVLFGKIMLEKVFEHLSPVFLFFTGDVNPRHSTQLFGQLLHLDALLLLVGLLFVFKKRKFIYLLLPLWLLITFLPASITKATPHALRTLPAAPIFWLIGAAGVSYLLTIKNNLLKYATVGLLIIVYTLEFSIFWRFYTNVYPELYAADWQYGYQQVVETVNHYRSENPQKTIYFTREFGRPAMYYWFYSQTDPRLVQRADSFTNQDQGEYLVYESIDFGNRTRDRYDLEVLNKKDFESVENDKTIIKTIDIPSSSDGWVIVEQR